MSSRGAQLGNKNRLGKAPWNKGVKLDRNKYPNAGHTQKHSEETKKKMAEKKAGVKRKPFTAKTIEKMRNKVWSSEHRRKLSEGKVGRKNPLWKEEKADRTYSVEWTLTLRRAIRERDKYTCQICSEQQSEKAHAVHHIDYNKYNCSPDNLITLCQSCHTKTNHKREYWIIYFKNIQL